MLAERGIPLHYFPFHFVFVVPFVHVVFHDLEQGRKDTIPFVVVSEDRILQHFIQLSALSPESFFKLAPTHNKTPR